MTKRKIPDYEIGYAKPPAKHQFKPGQSGNPSGKGNGKKGKEGSSVELDLKLPLEALATALCEPVTVNIGGKTVTMTVGEAFVRKLLSDMMKAPFHQKLAALKILEQLGVLKAQHEHLVTDEVDEPLYSEEERRLLQIARSGLEFDGTDLNERR